MIAFEISIDGEPACTAGVSPAGVVSVVATWVRRGPGGSESRAAPAESFEEELTFDVGGLVHEPDGAAVNLSWLRRTLTPGQRITITVLETEAVDPPERRVREDPARVAQQQRQYYERLKREYGDA
jgi:hypothetical protein